MVLILLVVVVLAGAGIGVLTILEYRPADVEEETCQAPADGSEASTLTQGQSLKVMTWNIGFAGLGEEADFFMDGGSSVIPTDEETVGLNLGAIEAEIASVDPDLLLLQEVDRDSKRTYHIDETESIRQYLDNYCSSFSYNYYCEYVPYPLPTLGRIKSGIMTLSKYNIYESSRISLPCPFQWPVRLANLKRCLSVNRLAIEGSDKELVLVNLHLEAYDSGEGKAAQTAQLRELLMEEAKAGNYVIAGGDFNQTFSNVDISKYGQENYAEDLWRAGTIDADEFEEPLSLIMDADTPTCRSLDQPYAGADPDNFAYYVIDGFILSDNLTVESLETLDLGFVNSDHNPVVLEVELN